MIVRRLNCAAILVIVFLTAAIYKVKIASIVDVTESTDTDRKFSLSNGVVVDTNATSPIIIDDQLRHVMWFLQITDLHISSFADNSRIEQLKEFCAENVFSIRPSVVLATGDLTDGRTSDSLGSQQQEAEWLIYKDIVDKTGVLKVTKWLDVRGNHDNFDVPAIDSKRNYFRKYSVQGVRHARSYSHYVVQGEDTYSFIAVNACLEPGPRRPLNFIGMLNERDLDDLSRLAAESEGRSNVTIWFGHYPTSAVLSPAPGMRHPMRSSYAYLCGHFHTLGGLVPHMYTMQKQGFLELELGDWRTSRLYRVAAVDHGLLSFVDVRHGTWPVVLITNPKNALFVLADREPFHRMARSTHIRLLVFSTVNISSVNVSLDEGPLQSCVSVEGPLYVLPWRPLDYQSGVHRIRATAKDAQGRETVAVLSFSLDGSRMSFDLMPRLFLMCNMVTVFQVMLGLTVCMTIFPLCYVRLMHHYLRVNKLARPRYSDWIARFVMRKLWLITSIDQVFYPLVLMTIYVPLGPWFVGSILSEHVGIVFAWGMFVNGHFLAGGMSFAFAVFHMWTFNVSLMVLLATALDDRYRQLWTPRTQSMPTRVGRCMNVVRMLGIGLFFFSNAFLIFATYGAYGLLAVFLNPVRTWGMIAALVLLRWAKRAPASVFHSMSVAFPPHGMFIAREDND